MKFGSRSNQNKEFYNLSKPSPHFHFKIIQIHMRSERQGGSVLNIRDRKGAERPIVKMDDFQKNGAL